jgi:glucokinase
VARRLIGVDVGGTKVSVAVLEDGELSEPELVGTDTSSSEALVDQLEAQIRAAGVEEAATVGIGIPSVVDFATGTARASVNIPLKGVALRDVLGERLGTPVYVDNDATVAALAEATGDDGEPIADSLVMFTVGTGVGGGIVLDGRIYRGATGAAAELGHMIIGADLADGAPQTTEEFPQAGSLERLSAGRALDRLGEERGIGDGHAVVEAAMAGNDDALGILRILGGRLGVGIANAINTFDPDLVVIGGGVSAAGDLLLDPARESAERFVLTGVGTKTEIRIARHGPVAGVRGAALLGGQEADREANAT